jgi:hypothetical protein
MQSVSQGKKPGINCLRPSESSPLFDCEIQAGVNIAAGREFTVTSSKYQETRIMNDPTHRTFSTASGAILYTHEKRAEMSFINHSCCRKAGN